MANQKKDSLSTLFSEEVHGPFVTFLFNTHVAHQNVEKDSLVLKNFAKAAKTRFEKKFPEEKWAVFQEKIDALLADASFWRNGTASVSIILSPENTFVQRLDVPVDDQYYVDTIPYLLGLVKDKQFNYHYYLLALNRDSMKLYKVDHTTVTPVELSKEGVAYHSINTKDKEVEIDWVNYYQAVDTFLKDQLDNPEKLPLYLYALPENQTLFKKIAKNPYYDCSISVAASPAQATIQDIRSASEKIAAELTEKETASYNKLLDRKFLDQFTDISPAAADGKISHLFIATSLFVTENNEMSSEEYDRRKLLNTIAYQVIQNGGQVFVLDQKAAPDEKSLAAILRY